MPRIARSTIDEVNTRMDAAAVVGDYVRLERRGARYVGLCPFHHEKTPSFQVNPDQKLYYCFGCHKGGTVLDFVMEMDKLTFPEAVETLARKLGVEIVYESGGGALPARDEEARRRKDELFELYRRVAGTFRYLLTRTAEGAPALRYARERGVSDAMIELFGLGYAPRDRTWLRGFLRRKGYSGEFLDTSGLFQAKYPANALFAGRLMFPIRDRQGRVVAFGGRALDDFLQTPAPAAGGRPVPKYINSPEIDIYRKGETLFAIDLAIPAIRRSKTARLAEGYMDVIALHQAGVADAVAPLGTAFTDDQARLLRRWAERVVLIFDADGAGQAAAVKGILTCRRNGLACGVTVPGGDGEGPAGPAGPGAIALKDPADILRNHGPEALRTRAESFINDFEYLVGRAKALFDTGGAEGRAKAAAFVFPYIDALESEVSRDACVGDLAAALGATRESMLRDLRRYQRGEGRAGAARRGERAGADGPVDDAAAGGVVKPPRMTVELFPLMAAAVNDMAAGAFVLYPGLRKALRIAEIEDPAAKELFVALEECYAAGEAGADALLERITSPGLRAFYLERASSREFAADPARLLADGVGRLARRRLERRRDEIVALLRRAGEGGVDMDVGVKAEELLIEKMRIDEELRGTN